jgi:ABC-type antimicrobial peptide transport system permease subunit
VWAASAIALLLLMAAVNCATLLLARGAARRREIAVRAAMGAGALRVFRLVITGSLTLALLGGGAGLLLAWWGVDAVLAKAPSMMNLQTGIGPGTIFFAVAAALASGVAFGLAPALEATRASAQDLLRRPEHPAAEKLQLLRGASLLVIGEVALAIALMVGAGLMLRRQPSRIDTALLAGFSGVTLLLAASGVYAVMLRTAGRRAREFSIRLALGAARREVLMTMLGEALLLVGIGAVVGLATGIFAARALAPARTADLTTVLVASAILAAAAAPASYFPARAASRIEPRSALKN